VHDDVGGKRRPVFFFSNPHQNTPRPHHAQFQHAGDGGLYAELVQDRAFGGTAFHAGLIGGSGGGGGGRGGLTPSSLARLPSDEALAAAAASAAGAAARRWPAAAGRAGKKASQPAAEAGPPYPPTTPLPRAWAPADGTLAWVGPDPALPPSTGPRALALRLSSSPHLPPEEEGAPGGAGGDDPPRPPPRPRPALPWPPPPALSNPGYWGMHVPGAGASFALVSWVRVEGGVADARAAARSAGGGGHHTPPPDRVVEFALRPLLLLAGGADPAAAAWAPDWSLPPLAAVLVPVRPSLPGDVGVPSYVPVNATLVVGGGGGVPAGGVAAALTVRLLPPAPLPPPPPPPGPPRPRPPSPLPVPRHPALWLGPTSLFPAGNGALGAASPFDPDLLALLKGLAPAFLRVPGGCYAEGDTLAHAFSWATAVGPPLARPGHWNGVWGYWSTDGLGPLEFLSLAGELGAAPLWVAPTGIAHGDGLPPGAVSSLVADVLGLLDYATGDASTTAGGAARARAGRADPFPLFAVALGNEGCGKPGYAGAAAAMATALRVAYPQVRLIIDCDPAGGDGVEGKETPPPGRGWWAGPPPDAWDWHWYSSSDALFLAGASGLAPGAGGAPPMPPPSPGGAGSHRPPSPAPAWATEWAAFDWGAATSPAGCARGAAAEAAFLTGLEAAAGGGRVGAAAYAPLLAAARQPGLCPTALIVFDRATGRAITTPSYHVQRMWAQSSGAGLAPRVGVWSVGGLNTSAGARAARGVAASVSCPDPACAAGALWLKLVNYSPDDTSIDVQLRLPGGLPARAPALAGGALAATLLAPPQAEGDGADAGGQVSNSFAAPDAVSPVPATIPVTPGASSFQLGLPSWGVVVVEVLLDGGKERAVA
jgi:hypothetical protein